MNYRHAFHAGNFADVAKHLVLVHAVRLMTTKPKPLCVIDTHAGRGVYDLTAEPALRSPEWQVGIGRVLDAPPPPASPAGESLAPYLAALAVAPPPGAYPGSPLLARGGLRAGDRLVLVERHPDEHAALRATLRAAGPALPTVQVHAGDGYERLLALTPVAERRLLALIDPPFEAPDEFEAVEAAVEGLLDRMPAASVLIWRPLKDAVAAHRLERRLVARGGPAEVARLDLVVAPQAPTGRLTAAGVLAVNPPYGLAEAVAPGLAWLGGALALRADPDG